MKDATVENVPGWTAGTAAGERAGEICWPRSFQKFDDKKEKHVLAMGTATEETLLCPPAG